MFLRDNFKKLLQLAKSVETDLQNKTETCIYIQNKTETCIYIQNRNLTKQQLEQAKKVFKKIKQKLDDKTI